MLDPVENDRQLRGRGGGVATAHDRRRTGPREGSGGRAAQGLGEARFSRGSRDATDNDPAQRRTPCGEATRHDQTCGPSSAHHARSLT